jgi:hypothetical protein
VKPMQHRMQAHCIWRILHLPLICLVMGRNLGYASADRLIISNCALAIRTCAWRGVAAVFIVCAFFLQSYAVQTHIHGAPLSPHSVADQITKGDGKAADPAGKQSGRRHAPSPDDPNDCPLCVAAVHASAVFSVVPTAIAPSAMYFTTVSLTFTQTFHALYRGHDKEQRGPPSV